MRLVLGAAIAALACGAACFTAAAQTVAVTEKGGAFSFDKPSKWPALEDKSRPGGQMKEYVVGTANEECWFNIVPRPETATVSPASMVQSWSRPIAAADWTETTKTHPLISGATFKSASIDASKTFPVQQAVFQGKDDAVVVAIHPRPGQEIRVYCTSYDGKDHTATFQAVAASVSIARDAEYKTQILAARTQEAAPAAAPPPPADDKKKK